MDTATHLEPTMEVQYGHQSQHRVGAKNDKPISNKRKNKRGWGRKLKRKKGQNETKFSIFGSNSNGIKGKIDSLFRNVQHFKPSCITLQETKVRFPGSVKLDGYEIFENIREGLGGGLLTAVDKNTNPVLISYGNENFEAIIVELTVG